MTPSVFFFHLNIIKALFYRTDLYLTRGTLMMHKESIELVKKLGVTFAPELKAASVDMPCEGEHTHRKIMRKRYILKSVFRCGE